ncbi:secretion system protein E [Candidatus Woesearchaeota archaeon]|nr:secretion system protein E [Candidatus Woesearchaeota archaeon]
MPDRSFMDRLHSGLKSAMKIARPSRHEEGKTPEPGVDETISESTDESRIPKTAKRGKAAKDNGNVKGKQSKGSDMPDKMPKKQQSASADVDISSVKEKAITSNLFGAQKKKDVIAEEESSDKAFEMPEGTSFSIEKKPTAVELPPFEDAKKINVRYPLLPPYAYAHIYWDKNESELIYQLEEPELSKVDKELLRLIQLGLEEMINVSFIRAKESNLVMQYLEKNVQSILVELGAKISKETYSKIMYYIYRDSIGLNEIEPLMNDYFIEDIECNGVNYPLYIVHRKYQNLRTNVVFKSQGRLTDFVEKLAQKSGRYVSFARPLLDGTLPDGSRVNATYTGDVTTRGPTFTIRKFTKEPWTPVHLIGFDTATAEAFAFIWLAIENKFNIMVIGETASGKTTFLNSILHFVPEEARICSIEDTREINIWHSNWLPSVVRTGFGIPNVMGVQYGEITLFDLLRETFRQNPDYVVVGEVRGKETYVLFQGMASGHPSFSTFHAASVPTLVRRLETAPISLPASLVDSLDLVCVVSHIKGRERNVRRLLELNEIKEVKTEIGKVDMNQVFLWDAQKDKIKYNNKSVVFSKIVQNTSYTKQSLDKEFKDRTELLKKLVSKDITDFKKVNDIFNTYVKNKDALPKELRT